MCHYCHKLGHNPYAPKHKSVNCLDKGNTHSKKSNKTKDTRSLAVCSTCQNVLEMGNGCRDCGESKHEVRFPFYCWQHCPKHAHLYK